MCGFLVFLVIPLFMAMMEKVYIRYSVHIITELADTAAMSTAAYIETSELSAGRIGFKSPEELTKGIEAGLGDAPPKIDTTVLEVTVIEGGGTCSAGGGSQYDFIHILMGVSIPGFDGKPIEFFVHRDVEYPKYGRIR
jgi:hypothetical protein